MSVCMFVYIYMCVYVCVFIYVCLYTYAYIYIYIYTCVCVCVCVCVYMYIYIYILSAYFIKDDKKWFEVELQTCVKKEMQKFFKKSSRRLFTPRAKTLRSGQMSGPTLLCLGKTKRTDKTPSIFKWTSPPLLRFYRRHELLGVDTNGQDLL